MFKKRLFTIILSITVLAAALVIAEAGDNPAEQAEPTPPACDNSPKAGYIELDANGTAVAQTLITFTVPFCERTYALTANVVRDINTNGERIAVEALTPRVARVTMELDEADDFVYSGSWVAIFTTQRPGD